MSLISNIIDYGKSLLFIDETLKNLKTEAQNEQRDLALKALGNDVKELDKRVVKLETARDADVARIEAALAQVTAERKGMAADFERYMGRLQKSPQLPPTDETNN